MGQAESIEKTKSLRAWTPEYVDEIKQVLNKIIPNSTVSPTVLNNPGILEFLNSCAIVYSNQVRCTSVNNQIIGSLDAFESAQSVQAFTHACYLHSAEETTLDDSDEFQDLEILKTHKYVPGLPPRVWYGIACLESTREWVPHFWVRTSDVTIAEVSNEKILVYCGKKFV